MLSLGPPPNPDFPFRHYGVSHAGRKYRVGYWAQITPIPKADTQKLPSSSSAFDPLDNFAPSSESEKHKRSQRYHTIHPRLPSTSLYQPIPINTNLLAAYHCCSLEYSWLGGIRIYQLKQSSCGDDTLGCDGPRRSLPSIRNPFQWFHRCVLTFAASCCPDALRHDDVCFYLPGGHHDAKF